MSSFKSLVLLVSMAGIDFGYSQSPACFTLSEGSHVHAAIFSGNTLLTGDINNDGNLDIFATGSNLAPNTHVLLGTGNATFPNTINFFYPGSGAVGGVSGDFNADGNLDFVVSDFGNRVYSLLGQGNGTLIVSYSTAVASPAGICSADFNQDAVLDLAVASIGTNSINVLLGTGTGSFISAGSYSVKSNSFKIRSAKLNNDNFPDLAVINLDSTYLSILPGTATGGFLGASHFSLSGVPRDLVLDDLNGDGLADLAITYGNNLISISLGTGNGSFIATSTYSTGYWSDAIIAGYFNNDGVIDLATTNSYGNTMSVFIGHGNGTFYPMKDFITTQGPENLVKGDFNMDGKTDLATLNSGSGDISVFVQTTLPPLFITSSNSLICAGNTVTLTASGAPTYEWNNQQQDSATVVNPVTTTIYTVTGFFANGCENTAMYTQNVSNCTIVEHNTMDNSTLIYPNPTNRVFRFELNSASQILITTVTGQKILNSIYSEGINEIDLVGYPNGIYFIQIIGANNRYLNKLIKN